MALYTLPALLMLLAAWLIPVHQLPWVSWHGELLAAGALLVLTGTALARGWRARRRVAVPTAAWLPLCIGVLATIQFAFGQIAYVGSLAVILFFAAAAAAAAAVGAACASCGLRRAGLRLLAWTLMAGAALQWLVCAGQVFSLWPGASWVARTAYQTRAGGNFAQPNQAALLFVLAGAAAVYLHLLRSIRPAMLAAVLSMLALGLAMTQSRSGLLIAGVLCLGSVLRARTLGLTSAKRWAASLLALSIVLFQLWPIAAGAYWSQQTAEVNLTTSGRAAMWAQFADALRLRPWTGWGVMQVASAQNAIADRYTEVMAATFSHDVLLDLALWMGLPAACFLATMTMVWIGRRLRRTADADDCFCAVFVLALLVQSLTEFPYSYLFFIVPVFFAAGSWMPGARQPAFHIPWAATAVAWTAVMLLTSYATAEYLDIEEDFRVARFEALRVGATPAAYVQPSVLLLTQLGALRDATRIRPVPNMRKRDLDTLREVAELYPWGATCFRYAIALALNGDLVEARRQMAVFRSTQGESAFRRMQLVIDEMAVEQPGLMQLRRPE